MADRATIAFDMIGTTFSLGTLRPRLASVGLPESTLETLFAQSLRDYFALSHAGGYAPLKEVLTAGVRRLLEVHQLDGSDDAVNEVVGGLGEMDPVPGAEGAYRSLTEAGHPIVSLTNGSEAFTRGLLERSGLDPYVSSVISCDAIEVSKPHARIYQHAREQVPGLGWLVASHAWDCMGAKRAGLRTAWISSSERYWPGYFDPPDISEVSIDAVAAAILDQGA
jgi:2-haloacid dehalogenase